MCVHTLCDELLLLSIIDANLDVEGGLVLILVFWLLNGNLEDARSKGREFHDVVLLVINRVNISHVELGALEFSRVLDSIEIVR